MKLYHRNEFSTGMYFPDRIKAGDLVKYLLINFLKTLPHRVEKSLIQKISKTSQNIHKKTTLESKMRQKSMVNGCAKVEYEKNESERKK